MFALHAVLMLCLTFAAANPLGYGVFPNPTLNPEACGLEQAGWLCDPDHILSAAARNKSEAIIRAIYRERIHDCNGKQRGYQVAVALMDRTDRWTWSQTRWSLRWLTWRLFGMNAIEAAKSVASSVGDAWGVGHAECDDGIVLLISSADHVSYLRTAGGAYAALPDSAARAIVSRMNVQLKDGKKDAAVVLALQLISEELGSERTRMARLFNTISRLIGLSIPISVQQFITDCTIELVVLFLFMAVLTPWFGGMGLYTVLFPFALAADILGYIFRHCRRGEAEETAALRRIQREVEGLDRDDRYVQLMCPICLVEFNAKPEGNNRPLDIQQLPCAHRFHRPCIGAWLQEHRTCPLCRGSPSLEDPQAARDATYRMRLRLYVERLTAAFPRRQGTDTDAEVHRLFTSRHATWHARAHGSTWIQTIAPIRDIKPDTGAGSDHRRGARFGGGRFSSGGGAGGRW